MELLFIWILRTTVSLRMYVCAEERCGTFLSNVDAAAGSGNLPGSGTNTASDQECLDLCRDTATCNAMIRHGSGPCYRKSVDTGAVDLPASGGYTSYLDCDGVILACCTF